jgi:hypothetical protein
MVVRSAPGSLKLPKEIEPPLSFFILSFLLTGLDPFSFVLP